MTSIAYVDTEISEDGKGLLDIGAVRQDGAVFHSANIHDFTQFINSVQYVCGHNIIRHDLKYIDVPKHVGAIDTLYLSPLLFPRKPYHRLLKDDKLLPEQKNNPLNDALKAKELFADECNRFSMLDSVMQQILYALLGNAVEFSSFFRYIGFQQRTINLPHIIRSRFKGKICESVNIEQLAARYPIELAYTLSLIDTADHSSVTPRWLQMQFPTIASVLQYLCNTPCRRAECVYCADKHNIYNALQLFFGLKQYRLFDGVPLQEHAVQAAVGGKSILTVFPTGGGKSLTFQIPALMAHRNIQGLTVVISPLQSLMKDQVDNLTQAGIDSAVTINGLLNPIERRQAVEQVEDGRASLLYIAPESLRSNTVSQLLLHRNVVRFVIDEAHCFSAWGQDFRVDYLFIGDFIRALQEKKQLRTPIPVSCFTATAKIQVKQDIKDYFKEKLNLQLEEISTESVRKNLSYCVLLNDDKDKYNTLRNLISTKSTKNCPTIVYVSRTRRTFDIASRLTDDGYTALPFNGKMKAEEKIANQEAFIRGDVDIIVATSAFGMGVDKKDVRLVIHYDISDSLENYLQEAGRAGRDQEASECYVLFNENDLDKHFILLNQTKLQFNEIQQIWQAMKRITRNRPIVCRTALEIAREAGWNDTPVDEMETRVRSAIAALESVKYLKRLNNAPELYADSLRANNVEEAWTKILESKFFTNDKQRELARAIVSKMIGKSKRALAGSGEAESRIDYIADMLGFEKTEVVDCITLMKSSNILSDEQDMSAFIFDDTSERSTKNTLDTFQKLESTIIEFIEDTNRYDNRFLLKEINERALEKGVKKTSVKNIKTVINFWNLKQYIKKESRVFDIQSVQINLLIDIEQLKQKSQQRHYICRFVIDKLFAQETIEKERRQVDFSLIGLYNDYNAQAASLMFTEQISLHDMEDALLFLSKIRAVELEGGFLVLYNGMKIERLILDNKKQYLKEHYRQLKEYYDGKCKQIHIVGEYARIMGQGETDKAQQLVGDYFAMEQKEFIKKYFKGERAKEIEHNITPQKYAQICGDLSPAQRAIIDDNETRYIVAAAGPGSGKTKVLVHKLASLLLMEDVKHEQLLMLTFSRSAATEFKKRLMQLVGNAANFVEIKTFHSYCFDLLGKIGKLDGTEDIINEAVAAIKNNEAEHFKITKTVLVLDEAQDMDSQNFALVQALIEKNPNMRVIAVGDDDQNIYQFRQSNSKYMKQLLSADGSRQYELTDNYRSAEGIVALSNSFVESIGNRLKTQPCNAVKDTQGTVEITLHSSRNLEIPIVKKIIETYNEGTAAVLTQTNDEAMRVAGLLNKQGVKAKLIQSNESFDLYDLAEIRYFIKQLRKGLTTTFIDDKIWQDTVNNFCKVYADSHNLETCLRMLDEFVATCGKDKYINSFEEFIHESNFDDFIRTDERRCLYVSTIHKAKGREFDSVYLLLNNCDIADDDKKRKIYVAVTRAKDNLYIHSNTDIFRYINLPQQIKVERDNTQYPEPAEIAIQLTHRDVYLGFFIGRNEQTFRLHSGVSLTCAGEYLTAQIDGRTEQVAVFSKDFQSKMAELQRKGYQPTGAEVRFVVAWRPADNPDEKESAVLLPKIYFEKR